MRKRILAVLMVMAMAVGLVGCGTTAATSDQGEKPAAGTESKGEEGKGSKEQIVLNIPAGVLRQRKKQLRM